MHFEALTLLAKAKSIREYLTARCSRGKTPFRLWLVTNYELWYVSCAVSNFGQVSVCVCMQLKISLPRVAYHRRAFTRWNRATVSENKLVIQRTYVITRESRKLFDEVNEANDKQPLRSVSKGVLCELQVICLARISPDTEGNS